jgi:predicted amidophosphoribosyltransferase
VVCSTCRDVRGRIVDRARAVGAYDGSLRAIVHALKYEGRRSLARPLATFMRTRGADVLGGADWVVPVPLHPSRRRERGFNQAADLARHLGLPTCNALARSGRRIRRTCPPPHVTGTSAAPLSCAAPLPACRRGSSCCRRCEHDGATSRPVLWS